MIWRRELLKQLSGLSHPVQSNNILEKLKHNPLLRIVLIVAVSAIFTSKVPVYQKITPDSALYLGLAQNLALSQGYNDTIRNSEILPTIGHPLILSLFVFLNLEGYFDVVLIFVSFVFIGVALLKSSKSLPITVSAISLTYYFLKELGFNKFGIETSGIFTSALLVTALSYLYFNNLDKKLVIFSALSFFLNLLVRPTLLYISIAAFLFLLVVFLFSKHFKLSKPKQITFRFLLPLAFALFLIILTFFLSKIVYNDARFIRGTYAAMNLYLSNNRYLSPELKYKSVFVRYLPEADRALITERPGSWEEREQLLFSKTVEYVKSNPYRAMMGWQWRLDKYLGGEYTKDTDLYAYRLTVRFLLAFLLARAVIGVLLFKIERIFNLFPNDTTDVFFMDWRTLFNLPHSLLGIFLNTFTL